VGASPLMQITRFIVPLLRSRQAISCLEGGRRLARLGGGNQEWRRCRVNE